MLLQSTVKVKQTKQNQLPWGFATTFSAVCPIITRGLSKGQTEGRNKNNGHSFNYFFLFDASTSILLFWNLPFYNHVFFSSTLI